jgi:hypothetical protein
VVAWEHICHFDMFEMKVHIVRDIHQRYRPAVHSHSYNKELKPPQIGSELPSYDHFGLASLVSCRLELYRETHWSYEL